MKIKITEIFDLIYVVNLPQRTDRRLETIAEFEKIGIYINDEKVIFFPAIKPEVEAGFPNIGARGCFLSHYEILKQARELKLNSILFVEDDIEFPKYFADYIPKIGAFVDTQDWSILYLGHFEDLGNNDREYKLVRYDSNRGIRSTHLYAVNGDTINRLIEFLEFILSRSPGHPDGGPMHYDGALSTFRSQNPDIITLLACPNLGLQRSSKSDIAPPKWFDKMTGVSTIVSQVRKLKNRLIDG